MQTPYNLTERFGHIDLFFIGSCRVSLLPEPPPSIFDGMTHECGDDCEHEHDADEAHSCGEECEHPTHEPEAVPAVFTPPAAPTYVYKKLFIRQGFKTFMVEIPTELKISSQDFLRVFTASYEDTALFAAQGSPVEQWLFEQRIEYLGSIDPIPNE